MKVSRGKMKSRRAWRRAIDQQLRASAMPYRGWFIVWNSPWWVTYRVGGRGLLIPHAERPTLRHARNDIDLRVEKGACV